MAAGPVTSVTARNVLPNTGLSMIVMTYSKASATDFLTLTTNTPIRNARWALATDDIAGAKDPIVLTSGVLLTMSAETGAGRVLVVGNC